MFHSLCAYKIKQDIVKLSLLADNWKRNNISIDMDGFRQYTNTNQKETFIH